MRENISFWSLFDDYTSSAVPFLFIIDYSCKKPLLFKLTELPDNVFFKVNEFKNFEESCISADSVKIERKDVCKDIYSDSFNLVQSALHRGDSYLINLTFQTEISSDNSLFDIFVYFIRLNSHLYPRYNNLFHKILAFLKIQALWNNLAIRIK